MPKEEAIKPANKKVYKAKLARSVYQAHTEFFGYQQKKDLTLDNRNEKLMALLNT